VAAIGSDKGNLVGPDLVFMTPSVWRERRAFQICLAAAACVPVTFGLWGVLSGFGAPGLFADSQYRYLSAILFGMGIAFWIMVPTIERQRWPFRMLCALVVLGGLARGATGLAQGIDKYSGIALVMELAVTPALYLWRERIDRLSGKEE
jgi:hypothetical protein